MKAVYILNRCPTKKMVEKTPHEAWTRSKSNVSHLRVFGLMCFRNVHEQLRKKLDDRSEVMDVKSTFLNCPLEEEVYVTQPLGFNVKGQESKVYILRKTLYGLKQAPRAWNKMIDSFLIEAGFTKCVSAHGVYVNDVESVNQIILCLYVDDLLITRADKAGTMKVKSKLMQEFEMSDLGNLSYFMGMEF